MPTANWDLKITKTTSRFFRLFSDKGQKDYAVEPDIGEGTLDATFRMDDWSYGTGMLRPPSNDHTADTVNTYLGRTRRIADGYNIDLSEAGVIKNGPGVISGPSYSGTFVDSVTHDDRIWVLTTTNLYQYDGTTMTNHGAISGGLNIEVWQDYILIAQGATGYSYTKLGSGITAVTSIDAYRFAAIATDDGPRIWIQTDANRQVQTTADPITTSPTMSTALTIGAGGPITNMYVQSGYVFIPTQDIIYILVGASSLDGIVAEFDRRLRRRKSTSAFSISEATGQDTWLSDGIDIYHMITLGAEDFNLRENGPFYSTVALPFTNPDIKGTIVDISIDFQDIYVTTELGGNTTIYKGVETEPNLWTWSPLIRITGSVDAARVHKLTTFSTPRLYTFASGGANYYQLRDWTTFATSWQFETPYFIGADENEVKTWNRFKAFVEVSGGSGTVQAAGRTDGTPTYVNIGSAMGNGFSTANPTALQHRRVQLRFTMSGNSSANSVDLRSFTLEGTRVPELKRRLQATVLVETSAERDFLYGLRLGSFTVKDRLGGTERTYVLQADYPKEVELYDEIAKQPSAAVRLLGIELLS